MDDVGAMIGVRSLLLQAILLRCLLGQVLVDKKIQAWIGRDVVLQCRTIIQGDITQVTWKRNENGTDVNFLTFSSRGVQKLTPFAELRVEYLGSKPKEGTIMIRNVLLSDESEYTCIFTTFPLGAFPNTTTLTVQAQPQIHVETPTEPAVARVPYQTVGVCISWAAKPAASITWRTGGLDYNYTEEETKYNNRTVTTRSELRMVPGAGIRDRSVTCVISQSNGTSYTQTERKMSIKNVQYPPDSVRVEVRTLDNGTVQLICVEDSSPPATNFTWRRKDTFDSNTEVELGNEKMLCPENLLNGLYICEVTNPIGTSSAYLYVYKHPGHTPNVHAILWPVLILILLLAVCLYVYRTKMGKEFSRKEPTDEPTTRPLNEEPGVLAIDSC